MSKILKLDRTTTQALSNQLDELFRTLGDELGLEIRCRGGRYEHDGSSANLKVEVKVNDPEVKLAAARANWNLQCRWIGIDFEDYDNSGLRPEDFGTEFAYGVTRYKTVGIASRSKNSKKFPILVECVSDPSNRVKPGEIRMLPETAVKAIRLATDLANAKPDKSKPKEKAAA